MRKRLAPVGWMLLWLAGPLVFLLAERSDGIWGFPLDDAWIHQTYARSLAEGVGWTYAGGPPSAGSTSPLWTILQIPAFWLHIPPVVWSNGMGVLLLLATAAFLMLWVRTTDRNASRYAFFFCLIEWHLLWAAFSGMEILLYCAWIAAVCALFFPMDSRTSADPKRPLLLLSLGLIAGSGIWIRPEAILLSGLTLLAVIAQGKPFSAARMGSFLLGWVFPMLLFFIFTFRLGGHFMPNTFYVKSAEYAPLTSASLILRLLQPWLPLLAGPLAVLIFFIPSALTSAVRNRKWIGCLPFLWALGHLAAYAVQLPATYQHGRYFIPILPVLIGYGVRGYFVLKRNWENRLATRVVSRALWASALLSAVLFIWIGAMQFVRDVRIIDTETVEVSVWIREHTPTDTVVAAHDIGALGFFGQRRIIDLGGVTDLQALDLLSGSVSLREYLRLRNADLLMTMPDFFPDDLSACDPLPDFPARFGPEGSDRRTLLYDWRAGCEEEAHGR